MIKKFVEGYLKHKQEENKFKLKEYLEFVKDLREIRKDFLENYNFPKFCLENLKELDRKLKKDGLAALVTGSYYFGCPTEESEVDCYLLLPKGVHLSRNDLEQLKKEYKNYKVSFFAILEYEFSLKSAPSLYLMKFNSLIIGSKELCDNIMEESDFEFKGFNYPLLPPLYSFVFVQDIFDTPEHNLLWSLSKSFNIKYLCERRDYFKNKNKVNNIGKSVDNFFKKWNEKIRSLYGFYS
jgi:uncharacterized protein (DUF3820 family)